MHGLDCRYSCHILHSEGFVEWVDEQMDIAKQLGIDKKGLVISTDQLESLFGVGKRHGAGDVKDANRIAMRLPALCGEVTKEDAQLVLNISTEQQKEVFGTVATITGQRRQVLTHPGELEKLKSGKEASCFELILRPENRAKSSESPHEPYDLENCSGPLINAINDTTSPLNTDENTVAAMI